MTIFFIFRETANAFLKTNLFKSFYINVLYCSVKLSLQALPPVVKSAQVCLCPKNSR